MVQVPGIVVFKAMAMGFCNLTIVKQMNTRFFFSSSLTFCFVALALHSLSLTGEPSCVYYAQRFGGGAWGGSGHLQLSFRLLLLDLFCIQRNVTNTRIRIESTAVCMYIFAHTHMHLNAHTLASLYTFLLIFVFFNFIFLFLSFHATINSPDTWPFWANPDTRHSTAQ